jgi:hypothetical protein
MNSMRVQEPPGRLPAYVCVFVVVFPNVRWSVKLA